MSTFIRFILVALVGSAVAGCQPDERYDRAAVHRARNRHWVKSQVQQREAACSPNMDDLGRRIDVSQKAHAARLIETRGWIEKKRQREIELWPSRWRAASERIEREAAGDPENIEETIPRMFN